VPGLLAGRALTAEEVASAAGTAPDATARLLRAGMAVGLLAADSGGRFTLTEMGNRLGPGPGSLGNLAGFWLAPIRDAMAGLADHVRSGRRVTRPLPAGCGITSAATRTTRPGPPRGCRNEPAAALAGPGVPPGLTPVLKAGLPGWPRVSRRTAR
jgi:hypothetical protein